MKLTGEDTSRRMNMELNIKLDNFEGPLELLLHLVETKEMSISEINISQIIDEYLAVMTQVKESSVKIKVEFLLMATELLEIKALNVLKYKEREEKEKILEQKLVEYKTIRDLSLKLREMESEYNLPYKREGRDIVLDDYKEIDLSKLTLDSLFDTYYELLEQAAFEEALEIQIEEIYSMSHEMEIIKNKLKEIKTSEYLDFFKGAKSKLHMVYIFLAILELYREKLVELDKDKIIIEGS